MSSKININDLKEWINNNLIYSRGLICKKCKEEWFAKYKYLNEWNAIHELTFHFNTSSPTFPQRVWHIINDMPIVKCANPSCNNLPTFFSYSRGYLKTCSPTCAQFNPDTIEKICNTNIAKYGVKYGLSNKDIIKKREQTLYNKYGVKNVSQLSEISEKKQETCLANYGTKWFLERQDLKELAVQKKYGVKNIQQTVAAKQKRIDTRRSGFYKTLFTTDRSQNKCTPSFSEKHYVFNGIDIKHKFKCKQCEIIFDGWVHDGDIPRCPDCYPSAGSSLFEKNITEYVKSILPLNTIIEGNARKILSNNRELDIYIPSLKIAIECDGLFWHGEIGGNKSRKYHLDKTNECESKGIRLIHIFEDEWNKSSDIIKSKLSHILKVSIGKNIFARKCNIQLLSSEQSWQFLNKNHIQGGGNSSIDLGLFFNNDLIATMTFCKRRVFMKSKGVEGEYELLRYATSMESNVVGGAGKLLSYFIENYNPKKIISYADRRWTHVENNIYKKIGFAKISDGTPNYWYFGRGNNYKRHHRFGFAKHTLCKRLETFDPLLSEWQNMQNNGWDRIWDCGNLKYEWIKS